MSIFESKVFDVNRTLEYNSNTKYSNESLKSKLYNFIMSLKKEFLSNYNYLRLLECLLSSLPEEKHFSLIEFITNNINQLIKPRQGYFLIKKLVKINKNYVIQNMIIDKINSMLLEFASSFNGSIICQSILHNFKIKTFNENDSRIINIDNNSNNNIENYKYFLFEKTKYNLNKMYCYKGASINENNNTINSNNKLFVEDMLKNNNYINKRNTEYSLNNYNKDNYEKTNSISSSKKSNNDCYNNPCLIKFYDKIIQILFNSNMNKNTFKVIEFAIVNGNHLFFNKIIKRFEIELKENFIKNKDINNNNTNQLNSLFIKLLKIDKGFKLYKCMIDYFDNENKMLLYKIFVYYNLYIPYNTLNFYNELLLMFNFNKNKSLLNEINTLDNKNCLTKILDTDNKNTNKTINKKRNDNININNKKISKEHYRKTIAKNNLS